MTGNPEARSKNMRAIRSRNTMPELIVRRLTHRMGYRYRLHSKNLPRSPDLAFPGRTKAIFVHGCFWHRHDCVRGNLTPKTNQAYWLPKLRKNEERDARNLRELRACGWSVLVIWECEISDGDALAERIRNFLDSPESM